MLYEVITNNGLGLYRHFLARAGQGVLTEKQRPGWLSRLLDNLYPF